MVAAPRADGRRGAPLPAEPAADAVAHGRLGDPGRPRPAARFAPQTRAPSASPGRSGSGSWRSCCRSPGRSAPTARVGAEGHGAEPSAWELELEGARVVFVVSPELFRGFSGEGAVLSDLANADDDAVDAVADALHGEPADRPGARCRRHGARPSRRAVGARARSEPRAGSATTSRPRRSSTASCPSTARRSRRMHPRLLGARQLVEAGAVRPRRRTARAPPSRAATPSTSCASSDAGGRCTCAWFAKHRGERGPCKHVLAAEHARRRARVT